MSRTQVLCMRDATVLIATYNRAALLGATLDSLRTLRVRSGRRWEVAVVDNNSTDDTRAVVERRIADFPVPLRYLFEGRQGRSNALNAGIAAAEGQVIAMTADEGIVASGGWARGGAWWRRATGRSPTREVPSNRSGRSIHPPGST